MLQRNLWWSSTATSLKTLKYISVGSKVSLFYLIYKMTALSLNIFRSIYFFYIGSIWLLSIAPCHKWLGAIETLPVHPVFVMLRDWIPSALVLLNVLQLNAQVTIITCSGVHALCKQNFEALKNGGMKTRTPECRLSAFSFLLFFFCYSTKQLWRV